jgi:hypothetical protein
MIPTCTGKEISVRIILVIYGKRVFGDIGHRRYLIITKDAVNVPIAKVAGVGVGSCGSRTYTAIWTTSGSFHVRINQNSYRSGFISAVSLPFWA